MKKFAFPALTAGAVAVFYLLRQAIAVYYIRLPKFDLSFFVEMILMAGLVFLLALECSKRQHRIDTLKRRLQEKNDL